MTITAVRALSLFVSERVNLSDVAMFHTTRWN
jgi:hypothetical protein